MGVFDDPTVGKLTFGALCVVVLLWLITACVDAVNFEEDLKYTTDDPHVATTGWSTTVFMTATSSIAMACIIIGVVFFACKNGRCRFGSGDAVAASVAASVADAPAVS
jgi:hypothetical protein